MHHHKPVDRADKTVVMVAPAHRLGYWQLAQRLLKNGINQLRKRFSGLVYPGKKPLALIRFNGFQFGDLSAHRAGKTKGCTGGFAVGIKGSA